MRALAAFAMGIMHCSDIMVGQSYVRLCHGYVMAAL